ncbi:type II toxin-antitoxin system prevent-host-death family antitoxin [Nitriliruptor alkaliphilus]|uniref:type II toxin-antitoxin system prevent-host-death family antitoxin n=1 Tax=Nitriliruptor alkaliphilus TaxID=427918 RepID=UPI00316AE9F3
MRSSDIGQWFEVRAASTRCLQKSRKVRRSAMQNASSRVEPARGQLGRRVDDVARGVISLTKRGRPVAVLVNRDEWEALKHLRRADARDEL